MKLTISTVSLAILFISGTAGAATIASDKTNKGFAVAAKHTSTRSKDMACTDADIVDSLSLAASRGEYEPVTFTILAGRNFSRVGVKISPLSSNQGSLPASIWEIRYQQIETLGEGQARSERQQLLPFTEPLKVDKDQEARFWLTAHVSKDAAAGDYKGTVTITADGTTADLPLTLKVYNFDYGKLPGKHAVMIGTPDELPYYKDCAEHSMTAICSDAGGALETNPDSKPYLPAMERNIKMAMQVGLGDIYIAYCGGLAMTSKVKNSTHILMFHDYVHPMRLMKAMGAYRDICKEKGYPEIIWYIFDEPGRGDKVQLGPLRNRICKEVYEQVSEIPGIHTFLTMGHEEAVEFGDSISIHCYGGAPTPEDVETTRKAGGLVWRYSNGISMGTDPLYSRFAMGIFPWRCDWDGSTSWTYPIVQGNVGSDGKPVPNTVWEACREGVDDWYYILTLEKLITAANQSNNAARSKIASEALSYLDSVKQKIDPRRENCPFTGQELDAIRSKVAEYIDKLK